MSSTGKTTISIANTFDHSDRVERTKTNRDGLRGEMYCIADLARHGFEVFKGVGGFESCDLIALADGCCWRIQVKTFYPAWSGTRPSKGAHDVFARVFLGDGTVEYTGPDEFIALLTGELDRFPGGAVAVRNDPKIAKQEERIRKAKQRLAQHGMLA